MIQFKENARIDGRMDGRREGWKDGKTDRPYFIGPFWLPLGPKYLIYNPKTRRLYGKKKNSQKRVEIVKKQRNIKLQIKKDCSLTLRELVFTIFCNT